MPLEQRKTIPELPGGDLGALTGSEQLAAFRSGTTGYTTAERIAELANAYADEVMGFVVADFSGGTITAGTGNDFTLASARALGALPDGFTIAFTADRANTGASTLNVTPAGGAAFGAKALVKGAGAALVADDIVANAIYQATFDSATDKFYLRQGNAVAGLAPLASPAFTGTPTAPTPSPGDNTTKISTTAFVTAAITAAVNAILNGVSASFDTLAEIATALGLKAPLASPAFTGSPTAATQAYSDSSALLATTQFVNTGLIDLAGGFVNKFRNGTMGVWSRGTSGNGSAGSDVFSADGWRVNCAGANVAWSRVAGRTQTKYALKITGATSVTNVTVRQRIESVLAIPLRDFGAGIPIFFQIMVYNSTGGAVVPQLTVKAADAADDFSAMTTLLSAQNLQSCPDGFVTQVFHSLISTSNKIFNGLEVSIDFGNNFSTNGKFVEVWAGDIRSAHALHPPELRNISIEELICQRHLPAWRAGELNGGICPGFCYSTSAGLFMLPFRVRPRVAITGIAVSAAADFSALDTTGTPRAFTGVAFNSGQPDGGLVVNCTGAASLTQGQGSLLYGNTTASLLGTGAEI